MASVRARPDNGQLFIDFRWQGRRVRRQTTLTDTPSNRARLAKVLKTVEERVAAGTFDFTAFFPDAQQPAPIGTPLPAQAQVRSAPEPMSAASPLLRDFVDQWVKEHEVEWRRSHMRTLMSTIHAHLLPSLGDKRVAEISRADVLAFRATLAAKSGRRVGQRLSNKRINGVMGPLKQIMNEAADRFGFPSPTANIKPLKIRKSDVLTCPQSVCQLLVSESKVAEVSWPPGIAVHRRHAGDALRRTARAGFGRWRCAGGPRCSRAANARSPAGPDAASRTTAR